MLIKDRHLSVSKHRTYFVSKSHDIFLVSFLLLNLQGVHENAAVPCMPTGDFCILEFIKIIHSIFFSEEFRHFEDFRHNSFPS
jgi:hypothetical protein